MSKTEMILFVEDQINKGINREEAIRNLALFLNEDDPEYHAELWFQQKIAGE